MCSINIHHFDKFKTQIASLWRSAGESASGPPDICPAGSSSDLQRQQPPKEFVNFIKLKIK